MLKRWANRQKELIKEGIGEYGKKEYCKKKKKELLFPVKQFDKNEMSKNK